MHRKRKVCLKNDPSPEPNGDGEAESELRRRVVLDSALVLSGEVRVGVIVGAISSLLLITAYWPHLSRAPLLLWLGSLWTVSVVRLVWVYRNTPEESMSAQQLQRWHRRFSSSIFIVGCIWGLSAVLFAGRADGVLQYFYLLVLSGLLAGAAAAYSAAWNSSLAFILPTGVIASVWLLLMGGENLWLGAFLSLFTLLLSFMVLTASTRIGRLIKSRWRHHDLAVHYQADATRRRGLSGQIRVVTEESAALANSLHEKDLMLRSVVNQTPMVVMVIDSQNAIMEIYGRSASHLEQTFGQLPGRSIYQVFSGNPAILQVCRDALAGSEKITATRVGDSEYEFIASPYHGRDAKQIGMIMVGMDVSEAARLRRLQQEFVVHVNHQLRTPLTTILASLDMLTDIKLELRPETREELLASTTRSARRMRDLTETIDRLEAQAEDADQERALAREISPLMRKCFQEIRDQEPLHLSVSDQLRNLGHVGIATRTLEAVLSALISNALKYGRENSTIEVTISNETEQQREVVLIRLANQCDPIPEQQQIHLFEKFTVGDSSDHRIHYGLGLGLHTARRLLAETGGRIWLNHSNAQGTEFCISLPLMGDAESRNSP